MKPVSKWNRQTIKNRYQLGVSLTRLARTFDISREQVKTILQEQGVKVGKRVTVTGKMVGQWIGLYQHEGKSCEAIGAEYGVSENTVRNHLKAEGIKMRTKTSKYSHPKYAADVKRMRANGLTVSEIADVLCMHRNTVKRLAGEA